EDENEASDVMPNGGTAVVELNAPEPMHRYMVAFQRTLTDRDAGDDDYEGADYDDDEVAAQRTAEIDRLEIEPEDLKMIQETFNVHSIEEILETLKFKEEELIRIKSDFSIKMRNTLALQRIKFEKEINDMKKRMEEYDEYTKADDYLKKREEELRHKERTLEQQEEDLEELRAKGGALSGGVAIGEGVADSKDVAELREIIEEQALEVSQLETKVNRSRADVEDSKSEAEKEKRRRSELEDELNNLKKGSIAMMKYVTSMQRKKTEGEVEDLRRVVEEETRRRKDLEQELKGKDAALRASDFDVDKAIAEAVSDGAQGVDLDTIAQLNSQLRKRATVLEAKEKDLELKKRKILSQIKKL
ncbi:MAG: hypothetical protein KAS77_03395, partial [Thermoplasmata archaeon]|nr:hypothetical protein [Thermoplasmata archaeon]